MSKHRRHADGATKENKARIGPFNHFIFPLIRKKGKIPDLTSPESGSGADVLNEAINRAKEMGYTPVIGHEDGTNEPLTAENVVRALSRKRRRDA